MSNPTTDFAGNIRKILQDMGLTQASLAKQSGLSPALIYKYYHGKAQPSLANAAKIAKALRISVEVLSGEPLATIALNEMMMLSEMLEKEYETSQQGF